MLVLEWQCSVIGDDVETENSVCNITHGKMFTLASVSSIRRVFKHNWGSSTWLCLHVYMYMGLWDAKQLLLVYSLAHTICMYCM